MSDLGEDIELFFFYQDGFFKCVVWESINRG